MNGSTSLIALIGPHGSGKSTLAGAIARAGAIPAHQEIGSALRAQTNHSVRDWQPAFDQEVLRLELARDQAILTGGDATVIVESWHIGNLSFARARGSFGILPEYESVLREQLTRFRVAPLRLQISDDEFLRRCGESGITSTDALKFYRRVESYMEDILAEFREQLAVPLTLPVDVDEMTSTILAMEWLSALQRLPSS